MESGEISYSYENRRCGITSPRHCRIFELNRRASDLNEQALN